MLLSSISTFINHLWVRQATYVNKCQNNLSLELGDGGLANVEMCVVKIGKVSFQISV